MARRRAGVGSAAKLGLTYDEVVHLIAQDMQRPTRWVERHFTAGEALRYMRMSEFHPHPMREAAALLTAVLSARSKRRA